MGRRQKKEQKRWSYIAGERGRNWVRAYCDGCPGQPKCLKAKEHAPGKLYLEYYEVVLDAETGDPVPDPRSGEPQQRRKRLQLKGATSTDEAKRRADKLAAEFALLEPADTAAPMTLARLLSLYVKEVTPNKESESIKKHDRAARRLFTAFFDSQPEVERRSTRHPSTLDRTDWDRFIAARRAGAIPGWERSVKDRQVQYDLSFVIAVLNWATGRKEKGKAVLASNPWAGSIRASQGWQEVEEKNPRRPAMTEALREKLIEHGPRNWRFGAALWLERETRRRNSAIRQLLWSDVELERKTIRWRHEADKAGRENVTPLTPKAEQILRGLPSRGIGDTPVFPSETNPAEPTSENTFWSWMRQAKRRLIESIEDPDARERMRRALRGLGYHGEKRAGVRDPDFRRLPIAIQEELAGTNYDTLRRIYDEVSVEDMRAEMERVMGPDQRAPSDASEERVPAAADSSRRQ